MEQETDIVERLRTAIEIGDADLALEWAGRAADEIERLVIHTQKAEDKIGCLKNFLTYFAMRHSPRYDEEIGAVLSGWNE